MELPFNTKIATLLSPDRICNLIKYSNYAADMGGYIFEAGIYQGGSLEILAKYNQGKNILAIDSFEGLPSPTEGVDYHKEGDFDGVSFNAINGYFRMVYPAVRIVKGFIPKVFEYFDGNTTLCFSHIDLDLYQSILDTLNFVIPRTVKGGVILLDDYKVQSTPGCEAAIEEFFSIHDKLEITHRQELKFFDHKNSKSNHQYLIIK